MKKIFYLFLLINSFWIQAKTIIISDVDDTIRQTNVLSRVRMIRSVLTPTAAFPALKEIFNQFSQEKIEFHYLSASPECLVDYATWIKNAKIPAGLLYQRNCDTTWFRPDYTYTYKYKTIVEIIKKNKPSQVLLFGDNAEHDAAVYQAIKKDFSQLSISIYIRDIRVEATKIDEELKVKRLTEVNYFLTEKDLLNDATFNGLSEEQKDKIRADYQLGKLYPKYLYANLARRYKDELDLSKDEAELRAYTALISILR